MQTDRVPEFHVTYCTNIHPGESWEEVLANVERHAVDVKRRVARGRRFAVGLRLSARAAAAASEPGELERLRALLERHGLYVFTINGFPYGDFSCTRVKENVYRPDWLEPERLAYTNQLSALLGELLRTGPVLTGSVSTVPGSFKRRCEGPRDRAQMARQILAHVAASLSRRERGEPIVRLAIEPEPECILETTADLIAFYDAELVSSAGLAELSRLSGRSTAECEGAVRELVGMCLDTCHAAVEFEDADASLDALARAGIGLAKVQLSSGLMIDRPGPSGLRELRAFADDVYLHQVVVRRRGELARMVDLPEALAAAEGDPSLRDGEWRVHFHVPLFLERIEPFRSSQRFVRQVLQRLARDPLCTQLEVETYTWDVLPPHLRSEPVDEAIARELAWVEECLREASAGPPRQG